MRFERLRKDIEHKNGITAFVGHLFRGLAINGGDEMFVCKDGVEKLCESVLEFIERNFS